MTDIEQVKKEFEPWELLDAICWADLVLLVQFGKSKEDLGYCKGSVCNYCGKFGIAGEQKSRQIDGGRL